MYRWVAMAVGGILQTEVFSLRRDIGHLGACMVHVLGLIGVYRDRTKKQDHNHGHHADDVPEQLQPRISGQQSL
jgi:hypothetical protein